MDFNIPPQTISEWMLVLALVCCIIFAFWALGQMLDAKGYGPQMERLRERLDAFRDRYFFSAGKWGQSQAERLAGLRRREKREKQ
ncbi:hypothetical protein KUG47_09605 [Falsochrobactrum sp. TDYN1]|uniref:Uncharacterized protein n=1 Tax=Falsochrobactrum tianjinense TaxID=2706015 RepID=A0A949PMD6_9HYPH|nr:hypothetical protein [Falsochrobactrum sp. TDYN1]MBV2143753.1 hypothetical protein [Falsochrobactrum sp. TDYN1]